MARAIADASAEHNLGVPRSTNVPTAALEIIHPRNYAAHQFTLRGDDTVRRTKVAVLGFNETRRPPLVQALGGQELISRGRIWLEPDCGTIWRVEWIYAPAIGSGGRVHRAAWRGRMDGSAGSPRSAAISLRMSSAR